MRSFSFLELVVVLVIVGVLAILALPSFKVAKENALNREAEANLKLIQAAEKIYRMEISAYYACSAGPSPEDDIICINDELLLAMPVSGNRNWNYRVNSDGITFTAKAQNVKDTTKLWCLDTNQEIPYSTGCSWP